MALTPLRVFSLPSCAVWMLSSLLLPAVNRADAQSLEPPKSVVIEKPVTIALQSAIGESAANPAVKNNSTPEFKVAKQLRPAVADSSQVSSGNSKGDSNSQFLHALMKLLEEAVITRLNARVSLEKVAVEKGRVRLEGVLLRDANIGLRLENDGAKRLADALLSRYGQRPNAPAWLGVLQLARMGIFNELEISLKLEELRLRKLALDADALKVEGFAVMADAGANTSDSSTTAVNGELGAILKVLEKTAISRAEAHLNLDSLEARRLKVGLDGFALKNLDILVALRRKDADETSSLAATSAKP